MNRTTPPQGLFHIPTDRWAGRRTRRRADVRAVASRKTHFVWVSLKIDSRAHKTHPDWPAVNRTLVAGEVEDFERKRPSRTAAGQRPNIVITTTSWGPLSNRLHCLLLSHIPTGQVAVARTGRRAYEQKAQSRKTHLYEVG